MKATLKPTSGATERGKGHRLSTDGRWRSFPKNPHLLQYVSSGTFYGRTKVNGKLIRRALDTKVWTTAKLRLVDFLKQEQEAHGAGRPGLFSEAVALYQTGLDQDTRLKPQSKQYRLWCVRRIEISWPELWQKRIDEITVEECREWAAGLNQAIACHYYNNTIGTLRQILDCGIREYSNRTGAKLDNPTAALVRARIKQKELRLPEADQFRLLVSNVRNSSGGWGPRAADMIEFLAYSGLRVGSEARWVTWEDIDWERREIIVRGSPETGTKNGEIRRVPIIPDMEKLLEELQSGQKKTGAILEVGHCNESLTRACRALGIPRITHHDLRHLFATRCIESGVDIPTVSRWLGHKDGGALAMKVYGHLRNLHSQEMAKKVRF